MMKTPTPHDLLWLRSAESLTGITAAWVDTQWHPALPVVVRRDSHEQRLIPVGVRGESRSQRAAGWVAQQEIVRCVTPEALSDSVTLSRSPFADLPPLQAARELAGQRWPWAWGITGSAGYALATGLPVLHAASDLDLLIRAPQPLPLDVLQAWQQALATLPCRVDTQIETPLGGFALDEWLRDRRALLKTHRGPRLVRDPWCQE